MNLKIKYLLFFLVFASLLHSSVSKQTTDNSNFYLKDNQNPDYVITTGLLFKNILALSTSSGNIISGNSNDLSNGAVVCPGTVTLKSEVSGSFAYNQWYSSLYVPSAYDDANTPGNYVDWSGTVNSKPILFSDEKYELLKEKSTLQTQEGTLWNQWVAQYDLKLNKLGYNPVPNEMTNKKGKFSAICESEIVFYKNSQPTSLSVGSGSVSKSYTLSEGNYTFKSQLKITGCGITFQPVGTSSLINTFKMFSSRTSPGNGPEYSYTQSSTSTISLTVRDPIFTLDYDPSAILDNSGNPVCFSEKFSTKTVKVKIKNDGEVDLKLTGFEITNSGFSAVTMSGTDGFSCSAIGEVYISGCEIPKGTEKTVNVLITYDQTAQIPDTLNLKLDYEATQEICDIDLGDSGSVIIPISNSECDDTGGYYCIIDPPFKSEMSPDALLGYSFSVKYYNSNNQQVQCANNKWSIIPSNWDLYSVGSTAIVKPSGHEGYATLFAQAKCENNYDIKCGAALSSTSDSQDPPGFYAVIDPDENLDMAVNIGEAFNLHCFQKITGEHPSVIEKACLMPLWTPPSGWLGSWIANPSSGSTLTTLTPTYEGGCNPKPLELKAKTGIAGAVGNYQAFADVCAKELTPSCRLTPPEQANIQNNQNYQFQLQCFNKNNQTIPCSNTNWDLNPSNWNIVNSGLTSATISTDSCIQGQVHNGLLCADSQTTDGQVNCCAPLTCGNLQEIDDYFAIIDPDQKLDMLVGNKYHFDLLCYERVEEYPFVQSILCQNTIWSINPSNWALSLSNNFGTELEPKNQGSGDLNAKPNYNGHSMNADSNLYATEGYTCNIIPAQQVNMQEDTPYNFKVEFYFGNQMIQCNHPDWSLTPSNWKLIKNGFASTITPTTQGNGALFATGNCNGFIVECGAPLTTYHQIPDYFSIIDPSENLNMEVGLEDAFTLYCYEILQDYPWLSDIECQNIIWHPPEENGIAWNANPMSNSITTKIKPTYPGEGILSATSSYDHFAMEAFSFLFATDQDTCILSWRDPDEPLKPETESEIEIVCRYQGEEIDCNGVNWQATGAQIVSSSDTECTIKPSDSSEFVRVDAVVPSYNLICSIDGDSKAGKRCSIKLVSLGKKYGYYEFNATCKDGGMQIDCVDLLSDLGQSDFAWSSEIKDKNTNEFLPQDQYKMTVGTAGDYSRIIEIFNYFSIPAEREYLLTIIAKAEDSGSEGIGDISCELEMLLPSIYCSLFV
ncbi:MAG: hypothetical protein WC501_04520 [Candidatus Micrarchaeia archaeon]